MLQAPLCIHGIGKSPPKGKFAATLGEMLSWIARVQDQTVWPVISLWKLLQGKELAAHKKQTGRRLLPVRISLQVLCMDLNLIHEVFAVETSLAFSELSILVTAPQTLVQAEAGKKQVLFCNFVDRKLEHIKIKGAIRKPKCKHQLPL